MLMTPFKYHVGIDPAWKNLGLSIVKEDVATGELTLVSSYVMNPSEYKTIPEFVQKLGGLAHGDMVKDICKGEPEFSGTINSVTIERFVAYAGVSTSETENICMIIGALQFAFKARYNLDSLMLRAIDWKTSLVKQLFKTQGFDNPSTKLDKKFSLAAGNACLRQDKNVFKTDHEADATCLASYHVIMKRRAK